MVSFTASKIVGIIRGKQIGERSVQELMGNKHFYNSKAKLTDLDFTEFMDSDRYETTSIINPHILVFKTIFDQPWKFSVD